MSYPPDRIADNGVRQLGLPCPEVPAAHRPFVMANIEDEVILMSDITSFTEVMARSGLRLSIRRVTRDDRALLKDFFEGVSLEDLRFRFLTAMLKVSDEQIAIMVDVDHKQTEDFLAFIDDGTLVGTAMIATDPSRERAEVAIAVRADFKHRGVGWTLLNHAAEFATAIGIKTLEAVESRLNQKAIEVERDSGFTVKAYPGDATLVIVSKQLR
ncbi:GNAT family N-acetyltransferase [Sphingobium sp. D43FB]|uniref:GNAT family N-acetyltransferase n=1 Tax=Sphingobium sp. D43FB TaxID=2017595 RepID=UPI0020D0CF9B|nr:GNAT family N-acetyltransferase [Sphingobium sp. D43FB]